MEDKMEEIIANKVKGLMDFESTLIEASIKSIMDLLVKNGVDYSSFEDELRQVISTMMESSFLLDKVFMRAL